MPDGAHDYQDYGLQQRPGVRPAPRRVVLAIGAMLGGLLLIVASTAGSLLSA